MIKYPKIDSLYKRHVDGPFKNQFIDQRDLGPVQFSTDEFEALYDFPWIGTEKIDGTNIRIHWDGFSKVEIKGRTDAAQIPAFLQEKLDSIFKQQPWIEYFDDTEVTFFGEGYGAKIQKNGGNYISDGVDFILFDILIDDIWLRRDSIEDIANKFNLKVVPIIFEGTLYDAENKIKSGFLKSVVSQSSQKAEGLVLIPNMGLLTRMGNRIITKIKTKDY